MPLSIEKSFVMHGGKRQLMNSYLVMGKPLAQIDEYRDLSVIRSLNGTYCRHCRFVTAKASTATKPYVVILSHHQDIYCGRCSKRILYHS